MTTNLHTSTNTVALSIKNTDTTHLTVKPDDADQIACLGIPRHTIILQCLITSKERIKSEAFYNCVVDNCGDANVLQGTRYVALALKLYSCITLMITTNTDIVNRR